MMVNAIRCPTSNMHATMRQFHCTARCRLPLMQADRSLCMTTMCVGMSSTTCAFCQESFEGTHRKYTCRLSGLDRRIAGSAAFGAIASAERWRRSGRKTGDGRAGMRWKCGGMRNRLSKTTRKVRSRAPRVPTQSETCYSPLSISRSSRNGSALGGAEASCRIAP